jgi:hypothetical protein
MPWLQVIGTTPIQRRCEAITCYSYDYLRYCCYGYSYHYLLYYCYGYSYYFLRYCYCYSYTYPYFFLLL